MTKPDIDIAFQCVARTFYPFSRRQSTGEFFDRPLSTGRVHHVGFQFGTWPKTNGIPLPRSRRAVQLWIRHSAVVFVSDKSLNCTVKVAAARLNYVFKWPWKFSEHFVLGAKKPVSASCLIRASLTTEAASRGRLHQYRISDR